MEDSSASSHSTSIDLEPKREAGLAVPMSMEDLDTETTMAHLSIAPLPAPQGHGVLASRDGTASIVVRNVCLKCGDQLVYFQFIHMNASIYVWVSLSGNMSNLALAMPSRFESIPLTTVLVKLINMSQEHACVCLCQSLALLDVLLI